MDLYICMAFTKNQKGGNGAGVVLLDQETLAPEIMQAIAKSANLSETAFVSGPDSKGEYSVRFFTPVDEVPLCGHATLAAFSTLHQIKGIPVGHYIQNTGAGKLDVRLKPSGEGVSVFMKQPPPKHQVLTRSEIRTIKKCFSNDCIDEMRPVEIWDTGLRDVLLPIKNRQALNAMKVDFNALKEASHLLDVVGLHAFAFEEDQVFARNFAPLFGIDEEAATGTSNGALIAYLHTYVEKNAPTLLKTIVQGESMGAPSAILAHSIKNKNKWEIWVGGQSVLTEVRRSFEW